MTVTSLHERDFYGWVAEQCAALQAHDSSRLDWDGLREELEALGRQEYRELVSRLGVLLGYLLRTLDTDAGPGCHHPLRHLWRLERADGMSL